MEKKTNKRIWIVGYMIVLVLLVILFLSIFMNNLWNKHILNLEKNVPEAYKTMVKEQLVEQVNISIPQDANLKQVILVGALMPDGFRFEVYYEQDNTVKKIEKFVDQMDLPIEEEIMEKGLDYYPIVKIQLSIVSICIILWAMILLLAKLFKLLKKKEDKNWKTGIAIGIVCVIGLAIFLCKGSIKTLIKTKVIPQQEINMMETKKDTKIDTSLEQVYEHYTNSKEGHRVMMGDPAMGTLAMQVYSTQDAGQTWQLETENEFLSVHYDTQVCFIDEQVGFLLDPGRSGTENIPTLMVTRNGGKTYENITLEKLEELAEKNLIIQELPKKENGKLLLTAYIKEADAIRKYYQYVSKDNGVTWQYKTEE